MLEIPKILDIAPKMRPLLTEFNDHDFFLFHGGRAGGKTHAIARTLIYIGEKNTVRIQCGRNTKSSIRSSVYTIFCDLIKEFSLKGWTILNDRIEHINGTQITFEGFREQEVDNTKGAERIDILWIDEAQLISDYALGIIVPTIVRTKNAKVIFSMNRKTRYDPVYVKHAHRSDCLTIKINYTDNPFCSKGIKNEAEECRARDIDEFNHIWGGEPLAQDENVLFNTNDLDRCNLVEFFGDPSPKSRILAIDIANGGGDLSVAGCLDTIDPTRFKLSTVESWNGKDLMATTGRIVEMVRTHRPDLVVVDANGLGEGVYSRLLELGVHVYDFKGSHKTEYGESLNARAEAFIKTRDLISQGRLRITNDLVLKDLECIKYKFHSTGVKQILSKQDIKKETGKSPDFADMLSMACYCLDKVSPKGYNNQIQTSY